MPVGLKGLQLAPLLNPPPAYSSDWTKPTPEDVHAMERKIGMLRADENYGDRGWELLRMHFAMKSLELPSHVIAQDKRIVEEELRQARASGGNGEVIAGFVYRMRGMGWDVRLTGDDKGKIYQALSGLNASDAEGDILRAVYYGERVSVPWNLPAGEAGRMKAYLEEQRRGREAVARTHYLMRAIGLPQTIEPGDLTLMRERVEKARKNRDGLTLAEDLYFISQLPLTEAKGRAAEMPPLKRFRV